MKYGILVILAGMTACDGKGSDSGDSGSVPGGPPSISSYTGTCVSDTQYFGELVTSSATNGVALLNIWETGAPADAAWNEEHDLVSSGTGDFGETLDVTLDKVDTTGAQVSSSTTLFGCGAGQQFEDPNTLTYAVRIYDTDGNLAECGAFGDQPSTVGDGSYTTIGGAPSAASELTGCTVM